MPATLPLPYQYTALPTRHERLNDFIFKPMPALDTLTTLTTQLGNVCLKENLGVKPLNNTTEDGQRAALAEKALREMNAELQKVIEENTALKIQLEGQAGCNDTDTSLGAAEVVCKVLSRADELTGTYEIAPSLAALVNPDDLKRTGEYSILSTVGSGAFGCAYLATKRASHGLAVETLWAQISALSDEMIDGMNPARASEKDTENNNMHRLRAKRTSLRRQLATRLLSGDADMQLVVIKILHDEENFLWEAGINRHLTQLACVSLLTSSGCNTAERLIEMPFAAGGSVADLIAKAWSSEAPVYDASSVRRWARELFSGVAALHSAGFAHLDLKPANLLLASGGRVFPPEDGPSDKASAARHFEFFASCSLQICDFGLTRHFADVTKPALDGMQGSLRYRSLAYTLTYSLAYLAHHTLPLP